MLRPITYAPASVICSMAAASLLRLLEHPPVQPPARAVTERLVQPLVGPRDEPVDRHRDVARDLAHALLLSDPARIAGAPLVGAGRPFLDIDPAKSARRVISPRPRRHGGGIPAGDRGKPRLAGGTGHPSRRVRCGRASGATRCRRIAAGAAVRAARRRPRGPAELAARRCARVPTTGSCRWPASWSASPAPPRPRPASDRRPGRAGGRRGLDGPGRVRLGQQPARQRAGPVAKERIELRDTPESELTSSPGSTSARACAGDRAPGRDRADRARRAHRARSRPSSASTPTTWPARAGRRRPRRWRSSPARCCRWSRSCCRRSRAGPGDDRRGAGRAGDRRCGQRPDRRQQRGQGGRPGSWSAAPPARADVVDRTPLRHRDRVAAGTGTDQDRAGERRGAGTAARYRRRRGDRRSASMLGAGVFAVFGPGRAGGRGRRPAAGTGDRRPAWRTATPPPRPGWPPATRPPAAPTSTAGSGSAPFWGYLAGWGFVVGKTASCAAMALTFGAYAWPRPHARRRRAAVRGADRGELRRRAEVGLARPGCSSPSRSRSLAGRRDRLSRQRTRRPAPPRDLSRPAGAACCRRPGCCSSRSPATPASPRSARRCATRRGRSRGRSRSRSAITLVVYLAGRGAPLLAARSGRTGRRAGPAGRRRRGRRAARLARPCGSVPRVASLGSLLALIARRLPDDAGDGPRPALPSALAAVHPRWRAAPGRGRGRPRSPRWCSPSTYAARSASPPSPS